MWAFVRCSLLMVCAIALFSTSFAPTALARTCRQQDDREICLEQIQRSAKYHWRYRVKATVNGEPQPLTRYNCRDRTQTPLAGPLKGITEPFRENGVGTVVCQLLSR